MSQMTDSSRTTVLAGMLVLASAALGLWSQADPHPIAATAASVAFLAGIAVLIVGSRGEPGLARTSTVASTGLILFALSDVVSRSLLSLSRDGDAAALRSVGLVVAVLQVLALAGGVTGAVLVVRRHLLEVWTARALMVVVAVRVVFVALAFVPLADLPILLAVTRASLVVPLSLLVFAIALLLHGRTALVTGRAHRFIEAWRSSTDVV